MRQVPECRLEEIAKTAPPRIGAAKVTPEKAHGEVLGQFLRCVRVAHGAEEVTINGTVIAQQKLLLGLQPCIPVALVGLKKKRPMTFDAGQTRMQFFGRRGCRSVLRHGAPSVWRGNERWAKSPGSRKEARSPEASKPLTSSTDHSSPSHPER